MNIDQLTGKCAEDRRRRLSASTNVTGASGRWIIHDTTDVVGCTAPKHRRDIDFRCWPSPDPLRIPFRTRNCHYLRWLDEFFVPLPPFPLRYVPLLKDATYVVVARLVIGNYRMIIRSESHALIKWLWRRWKLGLKVFLTFSFVVFFFQRAFCREILGDVFVWIFERRYTYLFIYIDSKGWNIIITFSFK